ncbi:Pyridoxamine 5'-phosphate oxidase [Georgenia satyanarayanai]|uniref:Pyridoxamine 5'-phosphate oxidase n=1 Tax=Georgenia satyanarayanai TaxID=860221 RepID=A0A2Y9BZB3_9MICO|nr:pyridoxamine 5'-phosphate oxidase family protein [Georgenia satyanarayanai]PYF99090.1 pyridoxamine 5'-phosphate oxidase-like protein [Georgenia satyanarayanai]SSA44052.1 Pyridoxamine 5'-phosphate oxidase [Georgenia satyanarayanai]
MSLEVLGPRACRRLLDQVSVAWLAHCADGAAHMVPVNVAVHGTEVVVRSAYGRSLTAVVEGRLLTIAAGDFDEETRTGWSVTVTGRAHLIGDELVNPGAPTVDVWADLTSTVPVAVPMTTVTGRRVRR